MHKSEAFNFRVQKGRNIKSKINGSDRRKRRRDKCSSLSLLSHFSDLQSHHTHSIDFESFFTCPKKVSRLSQKCKGKKVSPTEMEFNTRTPSPLWINWQDLLHSFRNIPAFVDLLRRPLEHAKFQKGNDARFFSNIEWGQTVLTVVKIWILMLC